VTAEGAKVAVVGAGRVGSTLAYTLASAGVVREIVVIDANRSRAEGEAMDIAHAVPFYAPVSVRPGSLADAAGAAVTVIAATTRTTRTTKLRGSIGAGWTTMRMYCVSSGS